MRLSPSKSLPKNHVLKSCAQCDCPEGENIVDSGALLWSLKWSKHEKFQSIAQRYLNKCHSLKVSTVVFDGYEPSTKDGTRSSKCSVSSRVIDVAPEKNMSF